MISKGDHYNLSQRNFYIRRSSNNMKADERDIKDILNGRSPQKRILDKLRGKK